jgi:hypothetical protein
METKNKPTTFNPLESIIGEQLSAVQFVQDYLQLHFEDKGLTCYIWPKIIINGDVFTFGSIEYRNKLCEFIGSLVTDVLLIEKEMMQISFGEDYVLEINLDPKNPEIVGEIAIFNDEKGNWSIFD